MAVVARLFLALVLALVLLMAVFMLAFLLRELSPIIFAWDELQDEMKMMVFLVAWLFSALLLSVFLSGGAGASSNG